jgi:hypothetical protein
VSIRRLPPFPGAFAADSGRFPGKNRERVKTPRWPAPCHPPSKLNGTTIDDTLSIFFADEC